MSSDLWMLILNKKRWLKNGELGNLGNQKHNAYIKRDTYIRFTALKCMCLSRVIKKVPHFPTVKKRRKHAAYHGEHELPRCSPSYPGGAYVS